MCFSWFHSLWHEAIEISLSKETHGRLHFPCFPFGSVSALDWILLWRRSSQIHSCHLLIQALMFLVGQGAQDIRLRVSFLFISDGRNATLMPLHVFLPFYLTLCSLIRISSGGFSSLLCMQSPNVSFFPLTFIPFLKQSNMPYCSCFPTLCKE